MRRIAQVFLRYQPGHTLQRVALVNEAWEKLFQNAEPEFTAAGAAKWWGDQQRVAWDATIELAGDDSHQLPVLEVVARCRRWRKKTPLLAQI